MNTKRYPVKFMGTSFLLLAAGFTLVTRAFRFVDPAGK